ncbi:MAG TPA: malto-oligosyltrehalose trehalohydrolase [Pirellulales bacterium]|jgi:maltooligosyltrehalose trehalohydrolase|nr:malto-oligosyltrehalose trehalohydrolase [Pirellulales bacterium]
MAGVQAQLRTRLPIGAEVQPEGGVHFRVWAPRRKKVTVLFPADAAGTASLPTVELAAEADGYFAGFSPRARAGSRYGLRLDEEPPLLPDPASRSQPDGPHGLSEVIDPVAFVWQDRDWPGVDLQGQVIYELHIGTFTREGTFAAAVRHFPDLVDVGVTLVEVMPLAEFPGSFGWGYDGVDFFAPSHLYGTPDEFRRFVDAAHRAGLGVLLDVVYNHFGPVGNYLGQFSNDYLSNKHHTDWGNAINYDGESSGPVREFVISNAGYWIDEFHVDGLRLDAVQAIVDDSADSILAALTRRVREAAGGRKTLVIAENEFQDCRLIHSPSMGGYGLDGAWNDDFHHAARVAMTGHSEHYYSDYQGTPQELISAVKWGYLYQGQWNARQRRRRGSPTFGLDAARFITFLQNHDQVSNSPQGKRSHELTSPGRHRAMTALWALAPGTPLLFQGQEFSASAPFLYFADHEPDLSILVREGRHAEQRNFRRLTGDDAADLLADPCDRSTYECCKLDWNERSHHTEALSLHRDLLKLRASDPVFASQRADRIEGAVIAGESLLLRYFGVDGDDRLLLVNLGRDLVWQPAGEPLLAPPAAHEWRILWSSEDPRYGGLGTAPLDAHCWYVPGHTALVLKSRRCQAD